MKRLVSICVAAVLSSAASPALAGEGHDHAASAPARAPAAAPRDGATCEHGVAKALCARCNPKLAPVYKAKGDWCPEHARPETQCVPCHPELARKGVK
jgi:hypothetical protein